MRLPQITSSSSFAIAQAVRIRRTAAAPAAGSRAACADRGHRRTATQTAARLRPRTDRSGRPRHRRRNRRGRHASAAGVAGSGRRERSTPRGELARARGSPARRGAASRPPRVAPGFARSRVAPAPCERLSRCRWGAGRPRTTRLPLSAGATARRASRGPAGSSRSRGAGAGWAARRRCPCARAPRRRPGAARRSPGAAP